MAQFLNDLELQVNQLKEGFTNDPTLGSNPINQPFIDFVTLDGVPLLDGGIRDMNVDGSVTPQEFQWRSPSVPPANQLSHAQFISFVIEDERKIIDPRRFGGRPALTNGLEFKVVDDQDNIGFLGGSLFQNRDFYVSPDTTQTISLNGEVAKFRFDFQAIELRLKFLPLWGINVTVNDDLASLGLLNVVIAGRRETPSIPN